MRPDERRDAYNADITYGTNNEFGFDYLRDNMAWSIEERVQRGHNFAVVDETDSILIDEARTPLIISGPADAATKWYSEFARLVPKLKRGDEEKGIDGDYEVDEKKSTVGILESGVAKVEDWLGIDNLYESVNTPLVGYLNNAIPRQGAVPPRQGVRRHERRGAHRRRAHRPHPGRPPLQRGHAPGDRGQGGRGDQAGEPDPRHDHAAELLPPLREALRHDRYGDDRGRRVRPDLQARRRPDPDQPRLVRASTSPTSSTAPSGAKCNAVIDDIAERHEKGQPVLVGTTSVEKSEHLSNLLRKRGVPHEVLNAKFHEREAAIVAQAGRKGAVTVATNMAGRGTDIMLGGNTEFMAAAELAQQELSPIDTPEEYEAAWPDALERAQKAVAAEHEEVVDLGGLYVLGTERHESRRIDNQLRGRSGRQGDPGETRFYLSLEDDLMRLFKADIVDAFLRRFNVPDDVPIEAKMVSNAIRSAQTQVEAQNFEIRKNVLKYDEVMNRQRVVIYEERRRVLEGEDLHEQVRGFLDDTIEGYVDAETSEGYPEDWDLERLWTALRHALPRRRHHRRARRALRRRPQRPHPGVPRRGAARRRARGLRRARGDLGAEVMRELERRVVLSVLDRKWREHLYEMDYLQDGIGLRAMAQKDPLVEYQREGYTLFNAMMESIKEESVGYLFNVEVQVPGEAEGTIESEGVELTPQEFVPMAPEVEAKGLGPQRPQRLEYSAPDLEAGEVHTSETVDEVPELGPDASRAERRRAERAARKRDSKG